MGSEDSFHGVVDLVEMKALLFRDGLVEVEEIPAEFMEAAEEGRKQILEKLAEMDDELAELYLDEKPVPNDMVRRITRLGVVRSLFTPVFCGAAYKNAGIQPLLDAVADYLPSPLDRGAAVGTYPGDMEKTVARHPSTSEPFSALAFKIIHDPYVGQQIFARTYSGVLHAGDTVLDASTGKKERISRIFRIHAKDRKEIDQVGPGDIVALIGLKNTRTGHTLCDGKDPVLLESVVVPEPVISVKVSTASRAEEEKLHQSLRHLSIEDPSFTVRQTERRNETVIAGMGELHLEIIVDRLKTEFNVDAIVGRPSVEFRETVSAEYLHDYRHVKQSGGRGQYAHTVMLVEPNPGGGFEFLNHIVGGTIPGEYIPAIRKGVEDAMREGILADYQVVDVRVSLEDGSFHEVDSSEQAFRTCASICFKEAFRKAAPTLLEPIMSLEIATPDEYIGDVVGDLNRRRGKVLGMRRYRKGSQKIAAEAPLMELFGYATVVRSVSSGRANYSMEMKRYAPLPEKLHVKVLEEARKRIKGEE